MTKIIVLAEREDKRTIIYLLNKPKWPQKAREWINSLMAISDDHEEETRIEHIIQIEYNLRQLRYEFPPGYIEDQESLDGNKIGFPPYLPILSDHLNWIIVPRDGETEAYIYEYN